VPIPVSLKRSKQQIPGWGRSANVTAPQLRRLMPPYYGMVKCIDDNIGRILQSLREEDLLENTVIVFTSDHGDLCGEHGRLNKGVPYEGSARIPFLVYAPGKVQSGIVVEDALSCVDFLPTAMNWLDAPLGNHDVDGRDASTLFHEREVESKSWEDFAVLRSTPGQSWLAVATAQYKLVYSSADTPWLIDVKNDPNELTNVFAEPDHKPLIRLLTKRLADYCREHQDPYARIPKIQAALEANRR
jgi:arylsulfatase A-like enzyme